MSLHLFQYLWDVLKERFHFQWNDDVLLCSCKATEIRIWFSFLRKGSHTTWHESSPTTQEVRTPQPHALLSSGIIFALLPASGQQWVAMKTAVETQADEINFWYTLLNSATWCYWVGQDKHPTKHCWKPPCKTLPSSHTKHLWWPMMRDTPFLLKKKKKATKTTTNKHCNAAMQHA